MCSSEYHSTVHIISGWDIGYTTTYCAAVQFPTPFNNGAEAEKVSPGANLLLEDTAVKDEVPPGQGAPVLFLDLSGHGYYSEAHQVTAGSSPVHEGNAEPMVGVHFPEYCADRSVLRDSPPPGAA